MTPHDAWTENECARCGSHRISHDAEGRCPGNPTSTFLSVEEEERERRSLDDCGAALQAARAVGPSGETTLMRLNVDARALDSYRATFAARYGRSVSDREIHKTLETVVSEFLAAFEFLPPAEPAEQ